MNYTRILSALYVGTYPESLDDIETLKTNCGVTAVLSLQTDADLRERRQDWSTLEMSYRNLYIHAQRVPMRDFDYNNQRRVLPEAVRVLAKLLSSGHTVYLHCNAGLGRSPLVAMAYFYWCRSLSYENAIIHVENRRSCSPMKDLLEVTRQDLLRDEELRKQVAHRAFQLHTKRGNQAGDHFRDWVDAEREILREILCQSSQIHE